MITSAIKNQTSVGCSISVNPYMSCHFRHGITDKKSKKESNSIVSLLLMSAALPIRFFYMRTLIVFELKLKFLIKIFFSPLLFTI